MIEARSFPFGGVPVYNPQSLTKGEAIAQFHARQAAYESLLDLLGEERPSHVLIIGTRGMGKTTLLQRVHYGVEEDVALNNRYLVLAFPEEQYNVNRLHHFLLNAVDALADAMERLKNTRMLAHVEDFVEAVSKLSQEEIESRVPKFLAEVSQDLGQSFLMVVDNADRLFDTIEKQEQWRLRELLASRRDLTLFGATTQASEGIYGTDRAFFEFFKIHRLTPLTLEEVRELLLRLSESVEEPEGEKGTAKRRVQEWLDADAARLRTLVQLTGGNPRTTVLLFHLVLDGLGGGAREYLEQLLDQCTPGYKGRVDELPAQAQQVLDAVALKWDPVTAMKIGEETGLETNIVSTQLTRLVRQGILEKADPGDSKKALYQVAERFFNIWYLMRASRRVRAKLRWFVEFLRVFFESGELEKMAWERLERLRNAKVSRSVDLEELFACLVASGSDTARVEEFLRRECASIEPEWGPYLDWIRCPSGNHMRERAATAEKRITAENIEEMEASARKAIEDNPGDAVNWTNLGHVLVHKRESDKEAEAALLKAIKLDPSSAASWATLGNLLAVRTPERSDEAEGALRKAIELNPHWAASWANLGYVLIRKPERWREAEEALRQATMLAPELAWAWANLGRQLARTGRYEEAEAALRKAVSLRPKFAWAWVQLGNLLRTGPSPSSEDGDARNQVIDLHARPSEFWASSHAVPNEAIERLKEAEVALRTAVEISPENPWGWVSLGRVLLEVPGRAQEAAPAFRKAMELDAICAPLNPAIDKLLRISKELHELEVRLRNAEKEHEKAPSDLRTATVRVSESRTAIWRTVELGLKHVDPLNILGYLLADMPQLWDEGTAELSIAIGQNPHVGAVWALLGFILARRVGKTNEAEAELRKVLDLEPDNARNLRALGVLLYCEFLAIDDAALYIRRAVQLDPANPVSLSMLAALSGGDLAAIVVEALGEGDFWDELLELCQNYPPFGKILLRICDLVLEHDSSNKLVLLPQSVALAQLGEFPRASVALEDALVGDPIDLLSSGRKALEIFFAAAVRNRRIQDCIELLDKKEWKDAWRPIYEALRSVQEGSADYLKRVAVEIREPALIILRRIAPELPDLAPRNG